MNRITSRMVLWISAVLWTVTGCSRTEDLGPPAILYGQQECEHCRMMITDERFAAGLVASQPDGRFVRLGFDDVNCLFDYQRANAELTIRARYVHDVNTRHWLNAQDAVYVISDSLPTPMASGVAAAATTEGLAALQQEHAGRVGSFAEVAARFARPGGAGSSSSEVSP